MDIESGSAINNIANFVDKTNNKENQDKAITELIDTCISKIICEEIGEIKLSYDDFYQKFGQNEVISEDIRLEPGQNEYIDDQPISIQWQVVSSTELKEYSFNLCKRCNMVFGDRYTLLKHNLKHVKVILTRCDVHKMADQENKMARSKIGAKNKTNPDSQFTCIKCGVNFKSKLLLNRHNKYGHRKKNKSNTNKENAFNNIYNSSSFENNTKKISCMVNCSVCGRRLKNSKNLRYHMERMHWDANTCKCTICGKMCMTSSSLRWHKNNYHGEGLFKFGCACSLKFLSQTSLNRHIGVCGYNRESDIDDHGVTLEFVRDIPMKDY